MGLINNIINNFKEDSISKEIENIIQKNPKLEFAFIKYPKQKLQNISRNQKENKVKINQQKLNYLNSKNYNKKNKIIFIHTHKKMIIPSPKDIFSFIKSLDKDNIKKKIYRIYCIETIKNLKHTNKVIGFSEYKIDTQKLKKKHN